MTQPRIRYATPPTMNLRVPECSACMVSVESDGDGWVCPVCGTAWSYNDGDEDPGTLYADWSGEEVSGLPEKSHDEGMKVGIAFEREQHEAFMARWSTPSVRPEEQA